jgi:hypothetical protein
MKFPVKIAVVVAFAAIFAVNTYGAASLKLDFDREWFVRAEHDLHDTWDIRDDYFEENGLRVKVYTVDTDFSKESTQQDLIILADKFDNCSGCEEDWVVKGTLSSWYEDLNNWVAQGN